MTEKELSLLVIALTIAALAGIAYLVGETIIKARRDRYLPPPSTTEYRNAESLRKFRENERAHKSLRN